MRGFIVLIFLAFLSTPALAEAPAIPTGSWSWAGKQSEVKSMEQTVDAIVDDMSIFMRPIARPRLKDEGKPWKRVSISQTGGEVTVNIDGRAVTSPLDRQVEPKDGLKLVRKMRGNVLVEKYTASRGGRVNEYHPTQSGLRVVSKIFAGQLPRPLEFSYTYR